MILDFKPSKWKIMKIVLKLNRLLKVKIKLFNEWRQNYLKHKMKQEFWRKSFWFVKKKRLNIWSWIQKKNKNLKISFKKHLKRLKGFNLHFLKLKKKRSKMSKKFSIYWKKNKSLNKFWKTIKNRIKQKWWPLKKKSNKLNSIYKLSNDNTMSK